MNKINFKEKKYVMPLLALPFLLLFVYVGAQLTREDTTEKDQPKTPIKDEKFSKTNRKNSLGMDD